MFKVSSITDNISFDKIWNDELNQLLTLFNENNFKLRIAGGAVRDILMNIVPHDIDFATDATPTEMKDMFIKHNIRIINANGESHGTVTPRINDKENFEITTLRIDKVTDGRRAEVEFTKDWQIDAERRDLTINSMFLDREGNIYDYFDGYNDIKNRIVRFVGDPSKRIQEDYLRILRYFRFYGRISKSADDHLEETINKIRENRDGLKNVSGERIWMEMRKIIAGNFGPEIIARMNDCKILPYLGLPPDPCLVEYTSRHPILSKNDANPAMFLATILRTEDHLSNALQRLKFSKDEYLLLEFVLTRGEMLSAMIARDSPEAILTFFRDDFIMHVGEPSLQKLRICYHEYLKYVDRLDIWAMFDEWRPPRFPIKGCDLGLKWGVKGKRLGKAMRFLKQKWHESNYTADGDDLVDNESFRVEFMSGPDLAN